MANTKISALTSATTPLAGTEVLPIVQSSATVKVATNDLTVRNVRANATTGILQVTGPAAASTRVMTVPDANFTAARTDAAQSFTGDQTLSTGNLVVGTSGKGIDFSATPGTGTSELFADYEEGTWTATTTLSGTGATYSANTATGYYTKVGRQVTVVVGITMTATNVGTYVSNNVNHAITVSGLPFTVINSTNGRAASAIGISAKLVTNSGYLTVYCSENSTTMAMFQSKDDGSVRTSPTYTVNDTATLQLAATYFV